MQRIMETADIKSNISNRDIEERFELLLETNDVLLDRAVSFHKDTISFIF